MHAKGQAIPLGNPRNVPSKLPPYKISAQMKIAYFSFIFDLLRQLFSGDIAARRYLYHRISRRFQRLLGNGQTAKDDYDWETYTAGYRSELRALEGTHVLSLISGDYVYTGGRLLQKSSTLPLHPNHTLLYETILQLAPDSVLEFGCGGGDHLHNLGILRPELQLLGVDRSADQLRLLKERHPNLNVQVREVDITLQNPDGLMKADLAYTQAVIMHIQAEQRHLTALTNLFNAAHRQVVLMENWLRHDFKADIQQLHAEGAISWKHLFLYFRESSNSQAPRIIVASATELPGYKVLDSYHILRGPD